MSNNILCVDDSKTMQTVAEITFRGSDWNYVGARNADEAEKAMSESTPSLVLVDAVMPDKSGYDLVKELKAKGGNAVFVMMCGNSEAYDEAKGSDAGCDGHITKPWQTDKLLEKLAEFAKAGPTAGAAAAAPAAKKEEPKKEEPKAAAPKVPDVQPPRSATLMGMPALEMPPSKPLPEGVAAIKTPKPAVPDIAAKAPAKPATPPAKPAAPAAKPAAASAERKPMIAASPGKPIRLVLASQAEEAATATATEGGMTGAQASALTDVSRELLEQIIWEVVPDLAEAIIRENLDTLAAK